MVSEQESSFAILMELVTQEPTLLGCLRILQSTCLAQGIRCTIKGQPASPQFAEFVSLHYSVFCENAIRCMYMCGFVPWRLRKIPGGDVIPEVLPIGSFHWSISANPKNVKARDKTQKKNESLQQRQKRGLSNQRNPVHMDDTATLAYQMTFVHGMPFTQDDIEVYEHSQPHYNVSCASVLAPTIPSPLSHIIVDYRILRQAQIRHSSADAWNTQAKLLCSYQPPSDLYRINEGQSITKDWDYPQNRNNMESDANLPTDMEYNVHARDNIMENIVDAKPTDHTPLIYSLPQNTKTETVQSLNPIQDIDLLNLRLSKNIASILGIPFELISGGYTGKGAVSRTVENSRLFATNMLSLCRHLQELLRNVYVAAYGGTHQDVCFSMRPSPRISLETVDDLMKLLSSGIVSCGEAAHISNMLIGVELQHQGHDASNDKEMYRTPEQTLAEKHFKEVQHVNKVQARSDTQKTLAVSKTLKAPTTAETPATPDTTVDRATKKSKS
jgi:hypothetical protein